MQPGDRVAIAYAVNKTFGDVHQQGITDLMAERVVDFLEAIQIKNGKRHGLP